jgi:hypothetical protein
MDLIKRHYEKILLALVLLGLMGAVVYMLIIVPEKQERIRKLQDISFNPKIIPLRQVRQELFTMTEEEGALKKAQAAYQPDFTTGHNLFNPVLWQLMPTGKLRKIQTGNEIGPGALVVTDIKPIYLVISATNATDGHLMDVYREVPGISRPVEERHTIVATDKTNELFVLKNVGGSPENPTLTLELKSTHEPVTVSYDQPFRRVDGYTADIKYPPEPNLRPWLNMRPGQGRNSVLTFENGTYILVDVQKDSIVVSSQANNKKTPIYFNPANSEPH